MRLQIGKLTWIMRSLLRFSALIFAFAAVLAWFVMGANVGWTRTSVAVKTIDEVTGLEGVEYRDQFVPGLEVLGIALLACGSLAVSSLLFCKPANLNKTKV